MATRMRVFSVMRSRLEIRSRMSDRVNAVSSVYWSSRTRVSFRVSLRNLGTGSGARLRSRSSRTRVPLRRSLRLTGLMIHHAPCSCELSCSVTSSPSLVTSQMAP